MMMRVMLASFCTVVLLLLQSERSTTKASAQSQYVSIIAREPLTRESLGPISSVVEEFGFRRVPDRTMEAAGLVLLRADEFEATKRTSDVIAKLKGFQVVPVVESLGGVEVLAPRYLVFPRSGALNDPVEKKLHDAGFFIASRPGPYQSFFVVSRTLKANSINAELRQLRAMAGVARASAETFLVPLK